MIGKIKGKLVEVEGNVGLIETSGGVFYNIFLPPSLLSLSFNKNVIEVYTYLHVRDDALILFGFKEKKEYGFFKLLLSVSGVGPKTAYSVISYTKIDQLLNAVKNNDLSYFSKIPGLGKKTAMKIILELSQKLDQEFKMEKMYLSDDDKTFIDALVSLGFKNQEASELLNKVPKKLTLEEKIREGIRLATNPKKKV